MTSFYTDFAAQDFEREFGGSENNSGNESKPDTSTELSLGLPWSHLSKCQFPNVENILFGLLPGNVGAMFAVTNLGKTTLALNIALTMASGRTFPPFVPQNIPEGRRVLLIDGESTLPELKADLETMMQPWVSQERAIVEENLFILCDEEIENEPLNLSNPAHLSAITDCSRKFEPDLIIVDTLSALFSLRSENDNAEIKRVVMQPLKKLAKDANAVVWLLHHVGKQSEDGKAPVGAYLGRGGSSIGGLSRTVTVLKRDSLDPSKVIFSVEKAKGFRLEPVLMSLEEGTRWFVPTNEIVPRQQSNYETVVTTVKSFGRLVKRKEIVDALDRKMSEATITRHLSEAVSRNDLTSPKYGHFAPPKNYLEAYEEASEIM